MDHYAQRCGTCAAFKYGVLSSSKLPAFNGQCSSLSEMLKVNVGAADKVTPDTVNYCSS